MRRSVPVFLALAVAACGGTAGPPSAGTSPTPAPESAVPSPGPAAPATIGPATPVAATPPAPEPSPPVLEPDSLALVVTDDLRMRSEPGVRSDSRKLEPLLDTGTLAAILEGPVAASGFLWYRIHPLDSSETLPEVGWVAAAGKDGEPWLVADPTGCPLLPLDLFARKVGDRGLACYGAGSHTFEALIGGDETGSCFELRPPWAIQPMWFDECARRTFLVATDTQLDGTNPWRRAVRPAFVPGVGLTEVPEDFYLPSRWLPVSVTGQFDHPAALDCRAVATKRPDDEAPEPDPAVVVYRCRAMFVVTALEVLAEDG